MEQTDQLSAVAAPRFRSHGFSKLKGFLTYIFWDNSSIQYAGLNNVLPVKEPDVDRGRYRTYFKGLLNLVFRGRIIDKVHLAGSIPPRDNALWDAVERVGIETTLIPHSEWSGEADTTDFALQTNLLRLGHDVQEPGTIALLTGDGVNINSGSNSQELG